MLFSQRRAAPASMTLFALISYTHTKKKKNYLDGAMEIYTSMCFKMVFFCFFNSEGAKVFSWELKKFHLAALPNLLRESLTQKLFFKASSVCAAEFDAKSFE